MVLDEQLSGLEDKEMIKVLGYILVSLSRNEGFQFIIIEHKSHLLDVEGVSQFKIEKTNYRQGTKVIQPSIETLNATNQSDLDEPVYEAPVAVKDSSAELSIDDLSLIHI